MGVGAANRNRATFHEFRVHVKEEILPSVMHTVGRVRGWSFKTKKSTKKCKKDRSSLSTASSSVDLGQDCMHFKMELFRPTQYKINH